MKIILNAIILFFLYTDYALALDSSKFPEASSSVNIYRNTAYTISGSNGWRKMELNGKNWDLNNETTTVTNTSPSYTYSIFTPKVAGTYLVTAQVDCWTTDLGNTETHLLGLGIYKNGSLFTHAYTNVHKYTNQSLTATNTISLSLTDTIALGVYITEDNVQGFGCDLANLGPGMNYLSIQRLY